MNIKSNKRTGQTLLAVLAHPDDETFGMGGTLATYASQGACVHLVCATRGEVGEMDPRLMKGFNSVGERREAELRCAAEKLGLAEVCFLDYRDSGMPGSPDNCHPQALVAAPLDEVAAKVAHHIRRLRPQVVITFDPIGGYRHPDHIAIHQATVKAFYAAGDPAQYPGEEPPFAPDKLYFHTIQRGFLRFMVRLAPIFGMDPRHWGVNKDIDMVSIAEVDFPVHAVINFRAVMKAHEEAVACHTSQGGSSLSNGIFGLLRRWFGAKEVYTRAYPPPPPELKEQDLFAGIQAT